MADVLSITGENYETEVAAGGAVVLDFYATWCQPCKQIAPILDELADDYQGQLKVGKVDIDQAPDLAVQFGISGVPTLVFLKGGEKVDQLVGAHAKPVIEDKIKSIV
ncbi:MAG: thioredoxin [Planctomycetota bacterium]